MVKSTGTKKQAAKTVPGKCKINDKYIENGVTVSRKTIKPGDVITLCYNGILAKCGAEEMTAHIGYGEIWDNQDNLIMAKNNGIFETTFEVKGNADLNICFKDGAENWDNNSKLNYTYKVTKRKAAPTNIKKDKKPSSKKIPEKSKSENTPATVG